MIDLTKVRATLILAVLAGLVTLLMGLWSGNRFVTAMQRSGISALLFGCCGFLLTSIAEPYISAVLKKMNHTGKNIDIISDVRDDTIIIGTDEQPEETFRPFNSDTVKRVYRNT